MRKYISRSFTVLISALLFSTANADEFEVGQENKNFTVESLKVKVGDTVKFTNRDPYSHNVYSLSETKSFDLGSYPKGKFKSVTFDKSGTVEVECAIHPTMEMTIEVEK